MVKVFDPKTHIEINYSKNNRLTEFAKTMLKDFYLRDNEDPQEGFARAARAWSNNDIDLAQRIYNSVSDGHFMFASPVLSNAPLPNEKVKGLPISCFLSFSQDSIQGLIDHTAETRWLSILGGGVGGHWRKVRGVTDKSPGTIPFIHTMDSDMDAYMQGKMRRGSYAAYLDVSHPDIIEFLNLRVPTGDSSRKCHSKGFHNAINITDKFMDAVLANKSWDLVQPHNGEITETVSARDLWQQILEVRYRTGEPYLCFIDTANKYLPEQQKNIGLHINGSNLCLEGSTLITIKVNNIEEEIRMDDFNEKFSMGYYTDVLVKSYDTENDIIVWEKILASAQTGTSDELYEIESDDGKHIIRCTANHKIYTKNRGYIEAQYLEEDDEIVFDS